MSIIDGLSLIFAKNKGGGAAAASRRTKPVERREAKKELASKATLGNGTDLFPYCTRGAPQDAVRSGRDQARRSRAHGAAQRYSKSRPSFCLTAGRGAWMPPNPSRRRTIQQCWWHRISFIQ
jgi:hypothetical protein